MNSFKSSKSAGHIREWRNNHSQPLLKEHPIDVALRKARAKAEKEIFKQKVQAHLIMAGAMIVMLLMSFYW